MGAKFSTKTDVTSARIFQQQESLETKEAFHISGCAALDGFIYCIGGCCEQSVLGSCERYNPEINEWVTIPDMQTARFQVFLY